MISSIKRHFRNCDYSQGHNFSNLQSSSRNFSIHLFAKLIMPLKKSQLVKDQARGKLAC